jgi:phosphotriesterase-related protein
MQVETLKGPVDTADLGFVLIHEHIFSHTEGLTFQFPWVWDEAEAIVDARRQLREAYDVGVRTIVEHSIMGIGRDVPAYMRVAAELPINVIVATGLYCLDRLPGYFEYCSIDEIAEFFVRDIERGVQNTPVKAGFIKCVTDKAGVTEGVDKVLRASARAHRRTGKPISTHTDAPSGTGRAQQRIFAEEGVDLGRIIIGHSGDTDDIDYLKELMDAGSTLDMGRISAHILLPNEVRVRVLAELCAAGYADRMTLSHDMLCACTAVPQHIYTASVPDTQLTYISTRFLPELREAGVTQTDIDRMTVQNPRRLFEQQASY